MARKFGTMRLTIPRAPTTEVAMRYDDLDMEFTCEVEGVKLKADSPKELKEKATTTLREHHVIEDEWEDFIVVDTAWCERHKDNEPGFPQDIHVGLEFYVESVTKPRGKFPCLVRNVMVIKEQEGDETTYKLKYGKERKYSKYAGSREVRFPFTFKRYTALEHYATQLKELAATVRDKLSTADGAVKDLDDMVVDLWKKIGD
jgi:hypothetical protein